MRERLPKVVDPVRVACRNDVVIDRAPLGRGSVIVNQAEGCHRSSSGYVATGPCPRVLSDPGSVQGPQSYWHLLYERRPVAVHDLLLRPPAPQAWGRVVRSMSCFFSETSYERC